MVERLAWGLPLLWGEGRGEGEWAVRSTAAADISKPLCGYTKVHSASPFQASRAPHCSLLAVVPAGRRGVWSTPARWLATAGSLASAGWDCGPGRGRSCAA